MALKLTPKKTSRVSLILEIFAIVVGSTALFVSFRSCSIAEDANMIAEKARNDVRAIEKLDLEPLIIFRMEFREIKDYPPHLAVTTLGPIEALQISIQLSAMSYDSIRGKIRTSSSWSEVQWSIAKLEIMQPKYFTLPRYWLEIRSNLIPIPDVMEACIVYRRDPDLKAYGRRAFYFFNREGRWVSERDQSIHSEEYADIIKAAHATQPCIYITEKAFEHGDPLKEFDPNTDSSTGR